MISFNKRYYKSLYKYKKLVNLQQNVPNKKKILKFKRQKWHKFINIFKNNLKRNRRKPLTIHNFCVSKFASMGNSFKKKFKNNKIIKKKSYLLKQGDIIKIKEFGIFGRGVQSEVGTYIDKVFISELSGNIIDLCPVGSFTTKNYD